MKSSTGTLAASLWLAFAKLTAYAAPTDPQLSSWPTEAATAINEMIARNKNTGAFACFDMDQTSYRYDLTESLLPFLENRGILTRENLDPALILIDFKDTSNFTETLYSYYLRLCEIDDLVCYPWIAQAFSGFLLSDLKTYVDEIMVYNDTIPVKYWDGDEIAEDEVNRPVIYTRQVELYNTLMANGIEVYVITAASEEIVRFVASDPKYGYNVKPENVIGVTTMLRNMTSGSLTNARLQIQNGDYDQQANLNLTYGSYLWTPATWFSGKWAAILTYIDPWKKPVLVGGDTPGSDGFMLFQGVDVSKGGVHLWVNRSASAFDTLQEMIVNNTRGQEENNLTVTADKNWVYVVPEQML